MPTTTQNTGSAHCYCGLCQIFLTCFIRSQFAEVEAVCLNKSCDPYHMNHIYWQCIPLITICSSSGMHSRTHTYIWGEVPPGPPPQPPPPNETLTVNLSTVTLYIREVHIHVSTPSRGSWYTLTALVLFMKSEFVAYLKGHLDVKLSAGACYAAVWLHFIVWHPQACLTVEFPCLQ